MILSTAQAFAEAQRYALVKRIVRQAEWWRSRLDLAREDTPWYRYCAERFNACQDALEAVQGIRGGMRADVRWKVFQRPVPGMQAFARVQA